MDDITTITDHDELIAIATGMGLNVDKRFGVEKLKNMIQAEYKAEHDKPTAADIASQRKVKLLIHKIEGDSGSTHVPVSVNGKTWLIRRGEEVEVPAFVVEVLKNAIKEIYAQDDVTRSIVMREVPAYPFSAAA